MTPCHPATRPLYVSEVRPGELRPRADPGIAHDKTFGIELDIAQELASLEANDTISQRRIALFGDGHLERRDLHPSHALVAGRAWVEQLITDHRQ